MRRWPSANRHTSARWTCSRLPWMTRSTLSSERVEQASERRVAARRGGGLNHEDLRSGAARRYQRRASVPVRRLACDRIDSRAARAVRSSRRCRSGRAAASLVVAPARAVADRAAPGAPARPTRVVAAPAVPARARPRLPPLPARDPYGPGRPARPARPRDLPRVVPGRCRNRGDRRGARSDRQALGSVPGAGRRACGGLGAWEERCCSTPASSRSASSRRAGRSCSCSRRRPRSSTATAPSSAPSGSRAGPVGHPARATSSACRSAPRARFPPGRVRP